MFLKAILKKVGSSGERLIHYRLCESYRVADTVRVMNTQKLVTTTMETQYDEQIIIRQCSEPTRGIARLYNALGYKYRPFTRKKSVVPQLEIQATEVADDQSFLSG